MEKDIKEAKQIIAEDHGFTNWNHLVDYLCYSNEKRLLNIYIDEVIEHLINTGCKTFDCSKTPCDCKTLCSNYPCKYKPGMEQYEG